MASQKTSPNERSHQLNKTLGKWRFRNGYAFLSFSSSENNLSLVASNILHTIGRNERFQKNWNGAHSGSISMTLNNKFTSMINLLMPLRSKMTNVLSSSLSTKYSHWKIGKDEGNNKLKDLPKIETSHAGSWLLSVRIQTNTCTTVGRNK